MTRLADLRADGRCIVADAHTEQQQALPSARWMEAAVLAVSLELPGFATSPGRIRPVQ